MRVGHVLVQLAWKTERSGMLHALRYSSHLGTLVGEPASLAEGWRLQGPALALHSVLLLKMPVLSFFLSPLEIQTWGWGAAPRSLLLSRALRTG